MSDSLVGRSVVVRGNEFIARDVHASIVMVGADNKAILLELDEPIIHVSERYRHIIASPRLVKDEFRSIDTIGTLGCSVIWVPDDKYNSNNPMDLSWWRGGAAAIADLYLY